MLKYLTYSSVLFLCLLFSGCTGGSTGDYSLQSFTNQLNQMNRDMSNQLQQRRNNNKYNGGGKSRNYIIQPMGNGFYNMSGY